MSTEALVLPADLAALRELGPWLAGLLESGGRAQLAPRLELALHELCVNVVTHAYDGGPGELRVSGTAGPDGVELLVVDDGAGFDREAVVAPTPGVPQEHGWGLHLVDQLVDEVHYTREEGQNRWLLRAR